MFLVLDFAGERAAKVLSESSGERRNFTASFGKGQDSAGAAPLGSGGVTCFEPGALARLDKRAWEEKAQTLRAHMGDNSLTVAIDRVIIENHANDSRYKQCDNVAPTVSARAGLGGGNVDLCVEIKPIVLDERKQAAPITEDYTGSLTATNYKGSPCVFAIQGNVVGRSEANGPGGVGFREDTAYTVNTVDKGGAVCYQETVGALCASDYKFPQNQQIEEGKAVVETFGNNGHGRWNTEPATLKAAGGDYPGGENMVVENRYAVRRLTPLECLRLQGYPDWWLEDFHIAEPFEADIAYWSRAWEDHRITVGKSKKPKSRNQIVKWLKNPYSDSNAYKAIGNSLAVPVAIFVMRGLTNVDE